MDEKLEMKAANNTNTTNIHDSVSFPDITAVATGWMLDFLFVSLCRSFKEGKLDEFNGSLSTFEGNQSTLNTQLTVGCPFTCS